MFYIVFVIVVGYARSHSFMLHYFNSIYIHHIDQKLDGGIGRLGKKRKNPTEGSSIEPEGCEAVSHASSTGLTASILGV